MSVDSDDCCYVVYTYCTCEEMPCAGDVCPYESIDDCPIHNGRGAP